MRSSPTNSQNRLRVQIKPRKQFYISYNQKLMFCDSSLLWPSLIDPHDDCSKNQGVYSLKEHRLWRKYCFEGLSSHNQLNHVAIGIVKMSWQPMVIRVAMELSNENTAHKSTAPVWIPFCCSEDTDQKRKMISALVKTAPAVQRGVVRSLQVRTHITGPAVNHVPLSVSISFILCPMDEGSGWQSVQLGSTRTSRPTYL